MIGARRDSGKGRWRWRVTPGEPCGVSRRVNSFKIKTPGALRGHRPQVGPARRLKLVMSREIADDRPELTADDRVATFWEARPCFVNWVACKARSKGFDGAIRYRETSSQNGKPSSPSGKGTLKTIVNNAFTTIVKSTADKTDVPIPLPKRQIKPAAKNTVTIENPNHGIKTK